MFQQASRWFRIKQVPDPTALRRGMEKLLDANLLGHVLDCMEPADIFRTAAVCKAFHEEIQARLSKRAIQCLENYFSDVKTFVTLMDLYNAHLNGFDVLGLVLGKKFQPDSSLVICVEFAAVSHLRKYLMTCEGYSEVCPKGSHTSIQATGLSISREVTPANALSQENSDGGANDDDNDNDTHRNSDNSDAGSDPYSTLSPNRTIGNCFAVEPHRIHRYLPGPAPDLVEDSRLYGGKFGIYTLYAKSGRRVDIAAHQPLKKQQALWTKEEIFVHLFADPVDPVYLVQASSLTGFTNSLTTTRLTCYYPNLTFKGVLRHVLNGVRSGNSEIEVVDKLKTDYGLSLPRNAYEPYWPYYTYRNRAKPASIVLKLKDYA